MRMIRVVILSALIGAAICVCIACLLDYNTHLFSLMPRWALDYLAR